TGPQLSPILQRLIEIASDAVHHRRIQQERRSRHRPGSGPEQSAAGNRALAAAVQQQGVTVTKGSPDFLMIVGVYDSTDKTTNVDVSHWLATNIQDDLSRIPGVGDVNVFGSQYAMRVWIDPNKLQSYQLMPNDVITAI